MGNPSSRITNEDTPSRNLRGSASTTTPSTSRGSVATPRLAQSPPAKKKKIETPTSSSSTSTATGDSSVRRSRGRPKGSFKKVLPVIETPVTGEKSPIKTRRILKLNKTNPHCTLCKKDRKEELKACFQCGLTYHLSHCLDMPEAQMNIANELEEWLCPKCIRCSTCCGIIDDVQNVECSLCLKAWHGKCFQGKNQGRNSVCKKCRIQAGLPAVDPSSSALSPQVKNWRKGRPTIPKRKLPKGWISIPEYVMHGGDGPSSTTESAAEEAVTEILESRERVWNNFAEELNKNIKNSPVKKDRRSRSPDKRASFSPLPILSANKISTVEDYDLFQSALRQFREEGGSLHEAASSSSSSLTAIGKWVYFGDVDKMKALYATPYPDEILRGEAIYVCPYCMFPTSLTDVYRIHRENCELRHPPGNEIYREGNLSFFEVDGAAQRQYCRNLCLLSKMFLSSKTLHHEVQTFLFYILTENTSSGCRMVGYFSKEKNPSKNNNLSCLLTLPCESRKGYGKLLIDLSYKLSKLEHKIGSPEHPLSDLGLFAYRGYWRASILQYLRSLHNVQNASIKSIALATRINPLDIVNQLMRDKLMAYVDGNYYIKTWKRAYKWPLSYFRRRAIDPAKLIWQPDFDVSELDANKLNYYV